jgi:hypothetical protein
MWNPLSWVMEAAAIMAIALANGGVSILFPLLRIFLSQLRKTREEKEVELSMFILMFLWFL